MTAPVAAPENASALFRCSAVLLADAFATAVERAREPVADAAQDATVARVRRIAAALQDACAAEPAAVPFAADVIVYEAALAELAASESAAADARAFAARNAVLVAPRAADLASVFPVTGRHVRTERFRFDVASIVAAIADCDRLEPLLSAELCTVLFVAPAQAGSVRRFRIGEDVRLLLGSCDGTRDAAALAASARASADAVLELLEALRACNALTYRETPR